jgi:hypothetical protein
MARRHQQAPREGTGLNATTALGTRLRYAIHRGLLPSPGLLPTTLIGIPPYRGYPSPFGSFNALRVLRCGTLLVEVARSGYNFAPFYISSILPPFSAVLASRFKNLYLR